MAALLILGGMVLCLLGWLWLWQRTAREHWVWALTGVLPPLALLSGLINGRVALLPLLVFVSGLGILAGGLWQLGQTQPQQLERLLQGHWKELADSDADVLQGQVQGQAFLPDQVSFRRGILVLRQGQDFIASKEVRLDLSAYGATLLDEHLKLDILPTDSGDLPLVEVFWQDARTGQPQARRVSRGYTLRLQLQPVDDGLQGQLYLSLPSRLAAFVSGRLHIEAAEVQPDPLWKLAIEAPVSQQETQLQAEKSTDVNKFSLERLLSDPDVYLHQTVQIETLAGRQIRGQFQGLNEDGELLIRQMVKAPGFVVFQVAPAEIGQIRLES